MANDGSGSPVAVAVAAGGSTGVTVPSDLTLNSLSVGAGGLTVSSWWALLLLWGMQVAAPCCVRRWLPYNQPCMHNAQPCHHTPCR